jgi:O-antigen/teichoic acid export membrane protein
VADGQAHPGPLGDPYVPDGPEDPLTDEAAHRRPETTPETGERRMGAQEVRSRAVRGAVSVGLRNLAVRAINLVGMVILARLLDPRDFGLLAFAFAVKSISDMLAAGGLAAGLIRREETPTRRELQATLGFQLTTTTALVCLIALSGVLFGGAAWVATVMAASLPIFALRVPTIVMLERKLDWSLPARAEIAETVVYNVISISLVVAGVGVWGVAAAASAQAVVGSALLIAGGGVGMLRPTRDPEVTRPLLRFGFHFQAVPLVGAAREQGVNMVIAAAGGIAMLGIWSAAYRVLQTMLLLLQSLWRVSYPAMARALEAGEDARPMLERILVVTAVLVGLPAVWVAGSAPDLVHAVFGSTWTDAVAVLPWGAAAIMIQGPVSTMSSGFLQARGDVGRIVVVVLVQAGVWIVTAALLIPSLGVEGAAVSMFVGAIVYSVLTVLLVRRHVPISVLRPMVGPVLIAAFAALAARFVADAIDPPLVGMLCSAVEGTALYASLLFLFRRADVRTVASTINLARRKPVAVPA